MTSTATATPAAAGCSITRTIPVYVPRTPPTFASIATQALPERLITMEDCLQRVRGLILPRNACRTPWSNRLDLRLTQTLRAGRGSAQIIFDLINLLNLLDNEWGRIETLTDPTTPLIRFSRRSHSGRGDPVPGDPLSVLYAGPVRRGTEGAELALPFSPAVPSSQWQARLGIRLSR